MAVKLCDLRGVYLTSGDVRWGAGLTKWTVQCLPSEPAERRRPIQRA